LVPANLRELLKNRSLRDPTLFKLGVEKGPAPQSVNDAFGGQAT